MSNVAKSEHTLLDGNLKNMWKDESITASAKVIFLKISLETFLKALIM